MVPSLKERGCTNRWYAVKKVGKRMQDKSLLDVFTTYSTRIILLPCVTTLFILPSQEKEMNSR